MGRETQFLRVRTPVTIGSRFGDWQVSWLGGWQRHRLYYLVVVVREQPWLAEALGAQLRAWIISDPAARRSRPAQPARRNLSVSSAFRPSGILERSTTPIRPVGSNPRSWRIWVHGRYLAQALRYTQSVEAAPSRPQFQVDLRFSRSVYRCSSS